MIEFINKNKNYEFSKFNDIDLKEYLLFLKSYLIDYRQTIDLDKQITFGVEFEYEDIEKEKMDLFVLNNLKYYKSHIEKKIDFGGEVISPVLNDNLDTWNDIKLLCNYLKDNKATMDKDVGLHVHVSVNKLGSNIDYFKQFILLYTVYEDIIYRFSNMDRINARRNRIDVAYLISITLAQSYENIIKSTDYQELKDILCKFSTRFQGLNINNVNFYDITRNTYKNTLEFRMANGTYEEILCQNTVNLYTKMISSSITKQFDFDKLTKQLDIIKEKSNYSFFNNIDIKKAIELSDIIFDNNLDKSNFLRQYLKDGTINNLDENKPVYSKIFIKN